MNDNGEYKEIKQFSIERYNDNLAVGFDDTFWRIFSPNNFLLPEQKTMLFPECRYWDSDRRVTTGSLYRWLWGKRWQ